MVTVKWGATQKCTVFQRKQNTKHCFKGQASVLSASKRVSITQVTLGYAHQDNDLGHEGVLLLYKMAFCCKLT